MNPNEISENHMFYEGYMKESSILGNRNLEDFLKNKPEVSSKADMIEDIVLKFGILKISKIAKLLRLKKEVVEFYLETLEKAGLIEIRTTLFDIYATATKRLIAEKRRDLVRFIDHNLTKQVSAKRIKKTLVNVGWERPLLDIILKDNASYIPMYLSSMKA